MHLISEVIFPQIVGSFYVTHVTGVWQSHERPGEDILSITKFLDNDVALYTEFSYKGNVFPCEGNLWTIQWKCTPKVNTNVY